MICLNVFSFLFHYYLAYSNVDNSLLHLLLHIIKNSKCQNSIQFIFLIFDAFFSYFDLMKSSKISKLFPVQSMFDLSSIIIGQIIDAHSKKSMIQKWFLCFIYNEDIFMSKINKIKIDIFINIKKWYIRMKHQMSKNFSIFSLN
jgi:hypothetical protein